MSLHYAVLLFHQVCESFCLFLVPYKLRNCDNIIIKMSNGLDKCFEVLTYIFVSEILLSLWLAFRLFACGCSCRNELVGDDNLVSDKVVRVRLAIFFSHAVCLSCFSSSFDMLYMSLPKPPSRRHWLNLT